MVILIICILLFNKSSYTQVISKNIENIDPKTINSSSYSFTFSNIILDWNIGELFSNAITDSNNIILTTGFLQPKDVSLIIILPTDVITLYDTLSPILQIYPNPVHSRLQIHNQYNEIIIKSIELFGVNGVLFKKKEYTSNIHLAYDELNIAELSPGLYILTIRLLRGDGNLITKVFKIVKF